MALLLQENIRQRYMQQSCPLVGWIRELGWVRLGRNFAVFDGLGRIWQKCYIFIITQHTIAKDRAS